MKKCMCDTGAKLMHFVHTIQRTKGQKESLKIFLLLIVLFTEAGPESMHFLDAGFLQKFERLSVRKNI
jgi:hypothetical protein